MRGGGLPGRAAELETAGGALDAVAVGERRLLTVLGEAGIGKTRLLAEIAEQARAARFVVIEGRATELERELPLVPVIDAAERYLGSPACPPTAPPCSTTWPTVWVKRRRSRRPGASAGACTGRLPSCCR